MSAERNHWIRLFNRLDAAVARHRAAKGIKRCVYCNRLPGEGHPRRCAVAKLGASERYESAFADDSDDALHAAHDRILKTAHDHILKAAAGGEQ